MFGAPGMDHLFEPCLGGMAVVLEVKGALRLFFVVDFAGVPVSLFGHALGAPAGPNAELGVAEPVWTAVMLQGVPRRLKGPCGMRRGGSGDGK
jgi:hypothetical protein